MNGARGAWVEIPVRIDALEGAVEQQPDQFRTRIERRRARIAAGGIKVGEEVHRHRVDALELVAAVILGSDFLQQFGRRVERFLAGVLGQQTFERGERQISHPVARRSAQHGAIGHAQRAVGIGIGELALRRLPAGDRFHIGGAQRQFAARPGVGLGLERAFVIVKRDRQLDERILARLELFGRRIEQAGAIIRLVEPGLRVVAVDPPLQRRAIGRRRDPQLTIEHIDPRRFGLLEILIEEQQPFGLVHRGIIAPVERLQTLPEEGHVAVLIARLALGIGLLAFLRQAIDALGGGEQLRIGRVIVPEIGPRRRGALVGQRRELRDRGAIGRAGAIASDPFGQPGFARAAAIDQPDAACALDLSAQVLFVIVEPRKPRFVFDPRIRACRSRRFDRVDPFVEQSHEGGILPVEGVLDLGQHGIALGRPGIARSHHEIAFLQAARADLEMMLGPVGDVLLGIVRRGTVGGDIGAVEGEIAGVARPLPVVDVAAVFADRIRRRIDQPHIAHFEPLDQLVLRATVEAGDQAAIARVLLAFGDDVLVALLEQIVARGGVERLGALAHPRGHVVLGHGHIDPRSGRGGQLVALGGREEAVDQIIVLGGGIVLHRSARAVVVGDHQPLGRDEARGTPAQRDDRPHREAGQVGQRLGCDLEPGRAQILGDQRQLVGGEHALLGGERRGEWHGGRAGEKGGDEGWFAHGSPDPLVPRDGA